MLSSPLLSCWKQYCSRGDFYGHQALRRIAMCHRTITRRRSPTETFLEQYEIGVTFLKFEFFVQNVSCATVPLSVKQSEGGKWWCRNFSRAFNRIRESCMIQHVNTVMLSGTVFATRKYSLRHTAIQYFENVRVSSSPARLRHFVRTAGFRPRHVWSQDPDLQRHASLRMRQGQPTGSSKPKTNCERRRR